MYEHESTSESVKRDIKAVYFHVKTFEIHTCFSHTTFSIKFPE